MSYRLDTTYRELPNTANLREMDGELNGYSYVVEGELENTSDFAYLARQPRIDIHNEGETYRGISIQAAFDEKYYEAIARRLTR